MIPIMPIFLFSITDEPLPLMVFARIQEKFFDSSVTFKIFIKLSILWPSTSWVSIPKPEILSFIGSRFKQSDVLPE